MRPEVIVHHLAQATSVLRVADELGVAVQLRSAPSAAASAGPGYLHALGEAAGQELLVDCGDDAGLVMAALRTGCRKLVFSSQGDERQRLLQMARRQGAVLRGPADEGPLCLTLSPDDGDETIRVWLKAHVAG